MTVKTLFEDLYRHMEWADATVWAVVLASEAARADTVTLGSLQHIHMVQRAFLSIWRNEPIDEQAGENLAPRRLATWAESYYGLARARISGASEEDLGAPVRLPWAERVVDRLGFEPGTTSLAETVLQVYFHTAHHRGQVLSRMRELGATPPLIDYIAWLWQGRPAPAWP